MNEQHTKSIDEALKKHPGLRKRMESILAIVTDSEKVLDKADDAELRVREELRRLGKEVLQEWAAHKAGDKVESTKAEGNGSEGHGRKKLSWATTYGTIALLEAVFIRCGETYRPFSTSAGVKNRGYSSVLQRVMSDFGAEKSFARASLSVKEHYGIDVPESAVRRATLEQAGKLADWETKRTGEGAVSEQQADTLIVQTDGSMVPIVEIAEKAEGSSADGRKRRKLSWQEAKLNLVRPAGEIEPLFAGTMGKPDDSGDPLLQCAIRAGFNAQTQVHAVGDGASWITHQVERVFGAQATYLVDFFHLCDYVSAAAAVCNPEDSGTWFKSQKEKLKESRLDEVIQAMIPHRERDTVANEQAPVRACLRYINNRPGQFNYQQAIEGDLPIGSGEIESANSYVVQERLKISGAWWKKDNAQKMLNLRTARQNGDWEAFWSTYQEAA
ncbi:MAG: ISKra4 family transposase [bacterium]